MPDLVVDGKGVDKLLRELKLHKAAGPDIIKTLNPKGISLRANKHCHLSVSYIISER